MIEIVLHTVGYGNRTPEDFAKHLLGINHIFDIRRKGSKAWCNEYHWGPRMLGFLAKHGIAYNEWPELANWTDSLGDYHVWIQTDKAQKIVFRYASVLYAAAKIFGGTKNHAPEVPCLLCAELDANKCHRKLVAEMIRQKLVGFDGVNVSVKHI